MFKELSCYMYVITCIIIILFICHLYMYICFINQEKEKRRKKRYNTYNVYIHTDRIREQKKNKTG